MRDRLLDRGGVEAEDLDPAGVRTLRKERGERIDRTSRQSRIGVRLDVELQCEPGWHDVENLIDEQRRLGARSPLAVEQPPREDVGG